VETAGQGLDNDLEKQVEHTLAVAVGTTIADRPPHRTVRALLRIRLPPWMSGEEASYRIRMQNAWCWNPPLEEPGCPVPRRWSLTATA
jgi:hypothetical protein